MLKNQKGFAGFEAVIIIIALVAIGAAGYFAYQARQDKTDYSVSVPAKTTQPVSKAATLNTTEASALVKKFYSDDNATWQNAASLTTYGTQNFITNATTGRHGADPFTCSQASTKSWSVKSATLKSGYVDVVVNFIMDVDPPDPTGENINVKVIDDSGKLKIDQISKDGTSC